MTEQRRCIALLTKNPSIQLTVDSLMVSTKCCLQNVMVRFGDGRSQPICEATGVEQEFNAVIFRGGDFLDVLRAPRLRLQAYLYGSVESFDIDLSEVKGVAQAMARRADCGGPGERPTSTAQSPSPPPPPPLTEGEKANRRVRAEASARTLSASPNAFGSPPPPPAAPKVTHEQVAAWHDEYVTTIAPLKQALGAYQRATAGDGDLVAACRKLRDVAISLAKLEEVTAALVGARDLRTSIGRFKDAGMACLAGKATHQRLMMTEGEQALGRFAQALAAYGLAP